DNISGLKRRVAGLLGLENPQKSPVMTTWKDYFQTDISVPTTSDLFFINATTRPLDTIAAESPDDLVFTYTELSDVARIFFVDAENYVLLGKVDLVEDDRSEGSGTTVTVAETLASDLQTAYTEVRDGKSAETAVEERFLAVFDWPESAVAQAALLEEVAAVRQSLMEAHAPALGVRARASTVEGETKWRCVLREDTATELSASNKLTWYSNGESSAYETLSGNLNAILGDIRDGSEPELDPVMERVFVELPDLTEAEKVALKDWYAENWTRFKDAYYAYPEMRIRDVGAQIRLVLVNLTLVDVLVSDALYTTETEAEAALDLEALEGELETGRKGIVARIQLEVWLGEVYAEREWYLRRGERYEDGRDLVDVILGMETEGNFSSVNVNEGMAYQIEVRRGSTEGPVMYTSVQLFDNVADARAAIADYAQVDSDVLSLPAESAPASLIQFHVVEHPLFFVDDAEGRFYQLQLLDESGLFAFEWPWMTVSARERVLGQLSDPEVDPFFEYVALESSEHAVDADNTRYRVDISLAVDDFVGRGLQTYADLNAAEAAVEVFLDFFHAVRAGHYAMERLVRISPHPWNFRVTVLVPDWATGKFQSASFRELLEKTLRESCPAHLMLGVHWIGKGEMMEFEHLLAQWHACAWDGDTRLLGELNRELTEFLVRL
ncbi:MAG: hypothetical protein AAF570_14240, partial [Bacteroidota bacterium]